MLGVKGVGRADREARAGAAPTTNVNAWFHLSRDRYTGLLVALRVSSRWRRNLVLSLFLPHLGIVRASFRMLAETVAGLFSYGRYYEVGSSKTPEGPHTGEERTCRHFLPPILSDVLRQERSAARGSQFRGNVTACTGLRGSPRRPEAWSREGCATVLRGSLLLQSGEERELVRLWS